jgi:hypothetical protein
MKINKTEAIRLVNQHKSFDAIAFSSLSDKKQTLKEIEGLLKASVTVLVMK